MWRVYVSGVRMFSRVRVFVGAEEGVSNFGVV
jgi:hypothetical protein